MPITPSGTLPWAYHPSSLQVWLSPTHVCRARGGSGSSSSRTDSMPLPPSLAKDQVVSAGHHSADDPFSQSQKVPSPKFLARTVGVAGHQGPPIVVRIQKVGFVIRWAFLRSSRGSTQCFIAWHSCIQWRLILLSTSHVWSLFCVVL